MTVAYKAFYYRLARPGFARFMNEMFVRLVEGAEGRLAPDGHAAGFILEHAERGMMGEVEVSP